MNIVVWVQLISCVSDKSKHVTFDSPSRIKLVSYTWSMAWVVSIYSLLRDAEAIFCVVFVLFSFAYKRFPKKT